MLTRFNLPWMLIAVFVSLCIFYYYNQKARIRREERRERLNEKRQEFLDALTRNSAIKDEEDDASLKQKP